MFNVGDTVKCVNFPTDPEGDPDNPVGKSGVVMEISEPYVVVDINDYDWYFKPTEIEAVNA